MASALLVAIVVLPQERFRIPAIDPALIVGTAIFLSAFANRYIKAVTRLSPSDCTSGFRCWRRDALAKIPLGRVASAGYAFLVEMLFRAAQNGSRIGEVPIIFVERRQGQSKVSKAVLMESLITPWRLRLRPRG
jgi:dolichol-phosphate mannosyltransferase